MNLPALNAPLATALGALAPLTSPALAGSPTAPTPNLSDSTQRIATTAFTQAAIGNALTSVLAFGTTIDASTNPNYPAAAKVGEAHIVSVAGLIGGGSGIAVGVGDAIVALVANAGGTQASVGASWDVLRHTLVGAALASNNLSDLGERSGRPHEPRRRSDIRHPCSICTDHLGPTREHRQ